MTPVYAGKQLNRHFRLQFVPRGRSITFVSPVGWPRSARKATQHVVYIIKNNTNCGLWYGKFSHCQHKLKLQSFYFTSRPFFSSTPNPQGLKATQASVELNQSAFLLMTSCLQLDSVPCPEGWGGWNQALRPGRAPSLPLPLHCSPRDLRAKGPLSYHFR